MSTPFQEFWKDFFLTYIQEEPTHVFLNRFVEFAKNHEGTVDAGLAEIYRSMFVLFFGQFRDTFTTIEKYQNDPDILLRYYARKILAMYYLGWLHIGLNKQKAIDLLHRNQEIAKIIVPRNEFERLFILREEYFSGFLLGTTYEEKHHNITQCNKVANEFPIFGKYYAKFTDITFGNFYLQQGMVETAREYFIDGLHSMPNSDAKVFYLNSLALMEASQQNFETARDYCFKMLDEIENTEILFYKRITYQTIAYIAMIENKIKIAENFLLRLLDVVEKEQLPVILTEELYQVFSFYLKMYHQTSDMKYLELAKTYSQKLMNQQLSDIYEEASFQKRFALLSAAFILKMGGMRDKVRAMDIFEDTIIHFPNGMDRFYQKTNRSVEIKVHLIELYFEDLSLFNQPEVINKIDKLMADIKQTPIITKSASVDEYISYQILVSKYEFYVKNNIDESLSILFNLKDEIIPLGLKKYNEIVNNEINTIDQMMKKWRDVALTVIERIYQSNIQSYLVNVRQFAERGFNL